MAEIFFKFFPSTIVAFIVSFITTPLVIWIYKRLKIVDDPKKQKHPKVVHKYPVPRGGGIPIFLGITLASFLFLPIDKHLVGIFLGAMVILIIGILDDNFDLNPYLRLLAGFLAAGLVIGVGIGIPFITNPLGGIIALNQPQIPIYLFGKLRTIWILADLFAFFWIVFCMNFVNWSKGLDGQLPGVVVIAAITIALVSLRFSADITQWPVAILALAVAGAYLGFLPFNLYPQKIMPGYGGGALAGYFLAVLSILATNKVGTLMMVLGVPLVDAVFVILRRIRTRKSPVWGDTRHLHHKLLALGWSKPKIALFYWGVTLILGVLALKLKALGKVYTILIISFLLGGFLLWLKLFTTSISQRGRDSG